MTLGTYAKPTESVHTLEYSPAWKRQGILTQAVGEP